MYKGLRLKDILLGFVFILHYHVFILTFILHYHVLTNLLQLGSSRENQNFMKESIKETFILHFQKLSFQNLTIDTRRPSYRIN